MRSTEALLPDWRLGNDDPLVYLSFGSIAGQPHLPFFPALYRAAIDALAPLRDRILVTVGSVPIRWRSARFRQRPRRESGSRTTSSRATPT